MPQFPWAKKWPEIDDPRVRAAFARVPRAEFVHRSLRKWAGEDAPLPIGEGQTISQPFVVALMTQALQIEAGERVLEIGTGSGFQTAILCELTRPEGQRPGSNVYSIERFASLSDQAKRTLNRLGYFPHLAVGDGAAGWSEDSVFNAILVTAAPSSLPRPLWQQLADNGRMIIPIGPRYREQMLWFLRKRGGRLQGRKLGPVRFVPLISPLLKDPANRIPLRGAQSGAQNNASG